MLLNEVQTYSLTHLATAPFSSAVSLDHCFAFLTEKGIDVLRRAGKTGLLTWAICLLLISTVVPVSADDATQQMFGDFTDGLPAAFGDFNSDEITDLFVIRNNSKTVEVLLGQDKEPVMYSDGIKCSFPYNYKITSATPGDFNGDALMDVMVTLNVEGDSLNHIVVLWGEMKRLNCTYKTLFKTNGQPLAIDYDKNMVIDLFGVDEDNNRAFWLFDKNSTTPRKIPMRNNETHDFQGKIRKPHSHAFLDLNDDDLADLYITTEDKFEIWKGNKDIPDGFTPWQTIDLPPGLNKNKQDVIGQTVFLDMELEGKLDHIVPVCDNMNCDNSRIFAYTQSDRQWHDLHVNFHEDGTANKWKFAVNTKPQKPYTETITLRAGDFNMDGYPDVMVTLNRANSQEYKSFFLKNVPCKTACTEFSRTFEVQWNTLSPYNNNTVLGVFFDFLQDGVLDLIFVHSQDKPTMFNVSAYRNTLDYDANFVKVMVVTGLTNVEHPLNPGPLRKSAGVYGTNLPGPKVMYQTTTQEGDPRSAVATQIPQSAHFTLNLPYTIFGLGRTPNFIDTLTVQVYGKSRQWTQLIPNSQMVVIPWPIEEVYSWKVQLFVTPSKLIFQSVLALLATCVFISLIIAALYWKERKEDHLEKLQEAHRFHFDAM
ncbi:T-cell immunomodulatory protein-like isoform X2 [Macrosteles quadrilineatus]|uniref:T-cell immunomodulatory protein-like isoform X2 n=1 Tax=Macrosteles quadrilineatus TaxID=74068 RepID=UPI0023E2DD81|nr:T-cell immunomodulatory protein-like isoform X2 [Macrosteles quadrilineatus]